MRKERSEEDLISANVRRQRAFVLTLLDCSATLHCKGGCLNASASGISVSFLQYLKQAPSLNAGQPRRGAPLNLLKTELQKKTSASKQKWYVPETAITSVVRIFG